jgi:two-component system phosphate regulon sensor histidine kinase PhoR
MLTPLAVIRMANELLLSQGAGSCGIEARSLHLAVKRNERRLEQLVKNILLAFEIETGGAEQRFESQSTEVELSLCVKAALQQTEAAASERDVTVTTFLPENLSIPTTHPKQLTDALVCLLDNAIKFSEPGGQVLVQAESGDGHIKIMVEDQGAGIPATEIPMLFQPFYQVDRHRNEQQGVGLGLFISKKLVEIQGGDIEVESTVGRGSTFTITLPMQ